MNVQSTNDEQCSVSSGGFSKEQQQQKKQQTLWRTCLLRFLGHAIVNITVFPFVKVYVMVFITWHMAICVKILAQGKKNYMCFCSWYIFMMYRVFLFHWASPKKLKYGKPRLGESTLT